MPLTPQSRENIFAALKKVMQLNCPPLVVQQSKKDSYAVMGNVSAPYGHKKEIIPGMYFSSAVARKEMVSFCFFPIYTNVKEFAKMAPTVSKCLKGKSCYNFKKEGQVVEEELYAMFKKALKFIRNKNG